MTIYKLLILSAISFIMTAAAAQDHSAGNRWMGTWAAAAEFAGRQDQPKSAMNGKSVRQIIKVSAGGSRIMLQLSNEFSSEPLEITSVTIADASDSCNINKKTSKKLTFKGKTRLLIPAGGKAESDAADYNLRPLQKLSVTISFGEQVPKLLTSHRGSRTTSYIYKGADGSGKVIEKTDHWYVISQLNVISTANAVAILGNSITDGRGSTTNLQNRWPDRMAESMGGRCGILNLGIGGNCVIKGGISEPAVKRFKRDILGQKGVSAVIIFEGTNDIGISTENYNAITDSLIAAYKAMTAEAHKNGLKVIMATITPTYGNAWFSFFHEAMRQTINKWIREQNVSDGVIDFDRLVRNEARPWQMKAEYSDDWLHLNPEGYKAMGIYAAARLAEMNLDKNKE